MLLSSFLAIALLQGATADDPQSFATQARLAIEGDSVARVRARWTAWARGDASSRPARFALATLARLTYDYAGAARDYAWLTRPGAVDDR